MNRTITLALILALPMLAAQSYERKIAEALRKVDVTAARGPFRPAWESLENYRAPAWYTDGKFGILIHWGVYAVPGFGNEWYPRNMYQKDNAAFKHHVATFGPQSVFGYKDFIPKFTAARYDPGAWAELFRKAGAKFVVPVAEHHDGFPLYDCSFTDWCAARMGPKRDLIGDLGAAVRKLGLHFGASSHRAEHWWFYDGGMTFDSDVRDPRYAGIYGPAKPRRLPGEKQDTQPDKAFLDDWLSRSAEIVDKYRPEMVRFDWWIEQPVFQPYLQRFAAFYYNRAAEWKSGAVITFKNKTFPEKAAVLDIERGKLDKLRELPWQTDTSISLKSWGYIENDEFRSVDSLVDDLVDNTSKNGVLLLNIGPRPDGTIPERAQQILLGIGGWLVTNGEAIYGARHWKVYGEGPTQVLSGGFTDRKSKAFTGQDIRFTQKGNLLYAIALDWPAGALTIKSLGSGGGLLDREISSIRLLGSPEKLRWKQEAAALRIEPPARKAGEYAYVFRLEFR